VDVQQKEVLSGVPQGSVLGPLLFLIYVNELPKIVTSSIKLFADDSKIWKKIQNKQEDIKALQQDLLTLESWSEKWLLCFSHRRTSQTRAKPLFFAQKLFFGAEASSQK